MDEKDLSPQQSTDETAELKNRLAETEETLQAIRQYMVDAFVVRRADSLEVVTLGNAEIPYRLIVESMNEGVATLISDGTIVYCNPYFGKMVMAKEEEVIGLQFRDFILPEEQSVFDSILTTAEKTSDRGEFCLLATDGTCVPVQLSVYSLFKGEVNGFAVIATDITHRVQADEKIRDLAAKLSMVEQEERHRISQILHDDLQQRLFAIRARLASLKEESQEQKSSSEIDQVQSWLSEAITITRSLSIDISPIILQGDGLAQSLSWLASQMKEQHGLQVEVHASEDFIEMDDQMRLLLYQAVRELLFNVVKHANTSQATVTIIRSNDRGRIIVGDHGKGFDAMVILKDPQAAHGLMIIKDRLGLLGGNLEIQSKPGDGTRVVIEIPLEQ